MKVYGAVRAGLTCLQASTAHAGGACKQAAGTPRLAARWVKSPPCGHCPPMQLPRGGTTTQAHLRPPSPHPLERVQPAGPDALLRRPEGSAAGGGRLLWIAGGSYGLPSGWGSASRRCAPTHPQSQRAGVGEASTTERQRKRTAWGVQPQHSTAAANQCFYAWGHRHLQSKLPRLTSLSTNALNSGLLRLATHTRGTYSPLASVPLQHAGRRAGGEGGREAVAPPTSRYVGKRARSRAHAQRGGANEGSWRRGRPRAATKRQQLLLPTLLQQSCCAPERGVNSGGGEGSQSSRRARAAGPLCACLLHPFSLRTEPLSLPPSTTTPPHPIFLSECRCGSHTVVQRHSPTATAMPSRCSSSALLPHSTPRRAMAGHGLRWVARRGSRRGGAPEAAARERRSAAAAARPAGTGAGQLLDNKVNHRSCCTAEERAGHADGSAACVAQAAHSRPPLLLW